jgi:quinol monooxygenase YgiN
MVSFIVRFTFRLEDREEIAEALRLLTSASRQEPGCVTYVPHYAEGDPDSVVIYEQYRDEPALAAHRASSHFKTYCVGVLFQKMKDRNLETLVALV